MSLGYCPGCKATRELIVSDTRPVPVDPESGGLGKEMRDRDYHCTKCDALIQTAEVIKGFRLRLPKNHTTGCIDFGMGLPECGNCTSADAGEAHD